MKHSSTHHLSSVRTGQSCVSERIWEGYLFSTYSETEDLCSQSCFWVRPVWFRIWALLVITLHHKPIYFSCNLSVLRLISSMALTVLDCEFVSNWTSLPTAHVEHTWMLPEWHRCGRLSSLFPVLSYTCIYHNWRKPVVFLCLEMT